ncbi:MAG: alpha-ribazole phosphatase [Burkholderiales bacterium]|nr:alpha-ribazole phosphatase [Flavobacterium sp.]
MEIYLVRHTETVCPKGVCYGQSDVGIIESYGEAFQGIVKQLPQEALLYSSPLQRCKILAKYILENTKTESIIEDARLMEMNFGDWELQKWSDIPKEILDTWMNNFVTVAVPNGESFQDLHLRMNDFWKNIVQKTHSKPIIIVAHSGIIRSVLCSINNIPLQDAFKEVIDYGAVVKILI